MSNFQTTNGLALPYPFRWEVRKLGVRSAVMLPPSTYLASATAMLLLQNAILNDPLPTLLDPFSPMILDPYFGEAVDLWRAMTKQEVPEASANSFQRI